MDLIFGSYHTIILQADDQVYFFSSIALLSAELKNSLLRSPIGSQQQQEVLTVNSEVMHFIFPEVKIRNAMGEFG